MKLSDVEYKFGRKMMNPRLPTAVNPSKIYKFKHQLLNISIQILDTIFDKWCRCRLRIALMIGELEPCIIIICCLVGFSMLYRSLVVNYFHLTCNIKSIKKKRYFNRFFSEFASFPFDIIKDIQIIFIT